VFAFVTTNVIVVFGKLPLVMTATAVGDSVSAAVGAQEAY